MRKFLSSLLEVSEVAVVAIVAVVIIRTFLVQPFLVAGDSMMPVFRNGDYLLVDELTYRLREPKRGEVIVFRYPEDERQFFIKRIIGLPGERVEISSGKILVLNGENPTGIALDEPYISSPLDPSVEYDVTLGDEEYFVLGDNRPFSLDSRSWGPVVSREVIGMVRLRLFPFGATRTFAAPQYK